MYNICAKRKEWDEKGGEKKGRQTENKRESERLWERRTEERNARNIIKIIPYGSSEDRSIRETVAR